MVPTRAQGTGEEKRKGEGGAEDVETDGTWYYTPFLAAGRELFFLFYFLGRIGRIKKHGWAGLD